MKGPIIAFLYPRCTSCAKAKTDLLRSGAAFQERHIRKDPPTRTELAELASMHPHGARAFLSQRSVRFRELGLAGREFAEEELLDLLAREPNLLRRPIISDGSSVVVGYDRPALQALLAR